MCSRRLNGCYSRILHRNISPDNIFLTKDWKIKWMDFGAARHAVDDSKSLSVFVKEGYVLEEQYQGKNQEPWTDVYVIAATFYRMVTGIGPQDAMDRKENDTLKPLYKLGVDIPENIEDAIMNALNRNMEDRTKKYWTAIQREIISDKEKWILEDGHCGSG